MNDRSYWLCCGSHFYEGHSCQESAIHPYHARWGTALEHSLWQRTKDQGEDRLTRLEKALGMIQSDIGKQILKVVGIASRLEDGQESYQRTVDSLAMKVKDLQMQINDLTRRLP